MNDVVYHFDGGGGSGDGPSGWAWVRNDGTSGCGGLAPGTTSNVAEYTALTMAVHDALHRYRDNGDTRVVFRGDSKLVVEQVTGNWRVNVPHLKKLVNQVQMLLDGLPSWELTWIPRQENGLADDLAWLGKTKWSVDQDDTPDYYEALKGKWPE